MLKVKEKIFKAVREKWLLTYKRAPIRLSTDFSAEALQARRGSWVIFSKYREKALCQPGILYQAKLFFRNERERKAFPDKQKLREFITTRSPLQEVLKEILQVEMKRC